VMEGVTGVMVAAKGDECVPVKLNSVAGKLRLVPPDHPWVKSARSIGVSMGDGPIR